MITFHMTAPDWEEISQRGQRRMAKQTHQVVADYWFKKILPRHFRSGARARYGYQPRTREHEDRKRRLAQIGKAVAPNVDLLLTGTLRTAVTKLANISAYPTRFSIRMFGPRYVTMKPKGGNMPYMAGEITTISPDENRELDQLAERTLGALAQEYPRRRRKRETIK